MWLSAFACSCNTKRQLLWKVNTLLTPGGYQNNTRQQNMHKERTHIHRCTLSSPSNWVTLAHQKGKFAHERFSIFKISSRLPLKFFFFNIQYWPVGSYNLILPNWVTVCSFIHLRMAQIWFFLSIPSSLLSKNKRKLPKPTSRDFRGITFYDIPVFFPFEFPCICIHNKSDVFTQIFHKLPWATCQNKG